MKAERNVPSRVTVCDMHACAKGYYLWKGKHIVGNANDKWMRYVFGTVSCLGRRFVRQGETEKDLRIDRQTKTHKPYKKSSMSSNVCCFCCFTAKWQRG